MSGITIKMRNNKKMSRYVCALDQLNYNIIPERAIQRLTTHQDKHLKDL